jgi:hypothetical protein
MFFEVANRNLIGLSETRRITDPANTIPEFRSGTVFVPLAQLLIDLLGRNVRVFLLELVNKRSFSEPLKLSDHFKRGDSTLHRSILS